MNQRAVAIILVAFLAVCFIGSCATAAFQVVSTVADAAGSPRKTNPRSTLPKKVDATPPPDDEPALDDDDDAPPDIGDPLAKPAKPTATKDDAPITQFEPPLLATAQYAVFHVVKPKSDAWKAVQKAAKAVKLTAYLDEAAEDAEPPYLVFHAYTNEDYAPLEGEAIDLAHGLTPKEREGLLEAKGASVVDVILAAENPSARLLDATRVLGELQKATGGVLWDEEAQEYFSGAEWKTRRIDGWEKGPLPDVSKHITVFVSTQDDGNELQTGGLEHFGLPDLRMRSVRPTVKEEGIALLELISQQLVEGTIDAKPGTVSFVAAALKHKARQKALKSLQREGAHAELEFTFTSVGTESTPLLEVSFPGSGPRVTRVATALHGFFGGESDNTSTSTGDADVVLDAISKKQMVLWVTLIKPRFKKGLKPGETLLVKAPFPADSGGNEWMWVEVKKSLSENRLEGALANTPTDVADLQLGDDVVVAEAELYDWMIRDKKGAITGNATGDELKRRKGIK